MLQENISLKKLNTFGIDAVATWFASFENVQELKQLLAYNEVKEHGFLVLGGGSNMLLCSDVKQVVLHNKINGIEIISDEKDEVIVQFGAGENWHECVLWAVKNDFAGIENLSLIPGTIGASPMQNIGAYGVELKDVFVSCEALNVLTNEIEIIEKHQCEFGYRTSIFKTTSKGKYIITSVTLSFKKVHDEMVFNTSYGNIKDELEKMNIGKITLQHVSNAVVNIRSSKLPNPADIGNAGSFFKNPVIEKKQYDTLKILHDTMPCYVVNDEEVKVPAGWLIEQCGWKGFREHDVGVHKNQALVLVNYGHASGKEILDLSDKIIASVKDTFSIELEREVNIM
jgi:UDP-N-acetylmuramate dehydrogenase